jgi:hypothetical protein
MAVLAVAVICLAILGIANMMLTFGLVRQMRIAVSDLKRLPHGLGTPLDASVGKSFPEFQASTVSGEPLTSNAVSTGTTFAVFASSSCDLCGALAQRMLKQPIGSPVVVFVEAADTNGAADSLAAKFTQITDQVAVITSGHSLIADLQVDGWPTVMRVVDGVVRASGHNVESVL